MQLPTVSAIAEVLERRYEVVPELVRVQVLHHRRDSLANGLEAIATVWGYEVCQRKHRLDRQKSNQKKGDRDWERGVHETDENNVRDYSNLSDPVPSPLPFPVYES